MKRITTLHQTKKVIILVAVLFFLSPNGFGQPTAQEKFDQATVLHNDALRLIDQGTAPDYREALAKLQIARRIYLELENKPRLAKVFVALGFASDALGKAAEALEFYHQAIPLFQETLNKLWEAKTLNNIGRIHDELGETKKALEYLTKSLPLRRAALDFNGEAVTLNAIGAVYAKLGEKERALGFYNQALAVRQSLLAKDDYYNIFGQAVILNNIGLTYDELGDSAKALKFLQESLRLRLTVGDKNGQSRTLNNIGLIYDDLNQKQTALDYYNQALLMLKSIGNESAQSTMLNNIGVVYADLGETQKASDFYQRALQISQKFKNKSSEATTLNNIGLLSARNGNNDKAIEYFNRVLPIIRTIGERNTEALTLHNLMLTWQSAKNNQLALFYGKQSVNKYQELRQDIQGLDPETRKKYLNTIESTYRQLADLLIEAGRFAAAEQVLRMLKEEEYFDFVRRDADEIKTLNQRISLTEKEKKLIERYQSLADRVSELGGEFSGLEKRKKQLSPAEEKRLAELEEQLADANTAFRLFLEKELVAEFGKTGKESVEYDRSLQEKLKLWGKGTVILYTVLTKDRYRVILTTPQVQIDGKTEISANELNKKIFAYREALKNIEIDPRPLGRELYDILIKPIEKDLKAANAKTLVWSLDGTLRYIPISTLSPDGQTYLVEKYRNVITTPKTRNDVSDFDEEWRALGLGVSEPQTITNPDNADEEIDFSPIPGTREELMTIVRDEENQGEKGILSGRRYLNKDFTINSLAASLASKNSNGKRKFTAVHIASHFQLGSNWTNSFLLLGNGEILTLKELKNSPQMDFGDVELVTLSACDTAFTNDSNGKEVDSLAEVIQSKSGKAVLAALWAVADESTPLLMSEFYRLRKENPQITKAEAMQNVQRAFVTGKLKPSAEYIKKLDDYYQSLTGGADKFNFDKNKPFAHPYFWSPFVLIGNWR